MKSLVSGRFITRATKAFCVIGIVAGVLLLASRYAMSHSGGQTGATNKNGANAGCSCHCATSNAATSVTISTSATSFEVNQSYTFTITVSNGNEVKAGCDVAVQNGTLAAGNDGLQLSNSELTQNAAKALPATWTFTYTAPSSAGTDTIFATGNAVNNDGTNNGGNCTDKWNFATKYVITVTAPLRTLQVTRPSIAFGNKRVGGIYTDTLHINSVGNASITVSSQAMQLNAPYTNSPTAGTTLTVGTSELQTITFSPTDRGTFNDSLVVISDANNSGVSDPTRQGCAVSGTGIKAIYAGQTTVPANTIVFGNVRVGQNSTVNYTFQNTGDDTLFISPAPTLSGTNPGAFTIMSNASPTVLAGAGSSVTLKFSPTAKQAYTAVLSVSALNGVSVPTINITGLGTAPILTVQDQTDIGTGKVGGQRNGSVTVSNGGDAPLNISAISLSNQFQGSKFQISAATSMQIQPSGSSVINVSYNPTALQRDTAVVTLTSDDLVNGTKQIMIFGTGGLPKMAKVTPDTIKLGDVRVGSTAQNFSMQIKNNGTYDLTVLGIDVTPNQFTAPSKPSTVSPNGSGQVTVQFAPTAAGIVNGSAIVHGDDIANSEDTVFLVGNGTISNFDVPSGVAFGDVKLNATRDTALKLRNLGSAAVKILKYVLTDPSNGFVLLDTSLHQINAHDSGTIRIRFNASNEQSYTGTLAITTDESSSSTRQVQLSGRAVNSKLQLSLSSLDFGTVDSATHLQKSFTITNNGTATAQISSLAITGSNNSSEFAVDSPATAFSITASGTKTVYVTFSPVNSSTASGTLTIGATEGTQPQVLLSGVGKGKPNQGGSVRIIDPVLSVIEVIPNPAQGSLATLRLGVVKSLEQVKLAFYNDAGELMLTQAVGSLTEGMQQIPMTLPQMTGVAFVRITAGGEMIGTVQIVITR
jgi:hypothetical protein